MIALALRLALPVASAWFACRGTPAPRLVAVYRAARAMRRARKLLHRANRAADRGAYARARRLIQRVAGIMAAVDAQGLG